jgi:anti-repressor protein
MIQIAKNITGNTEEKFVDAKDLYKSLKVKKTFKKWIKKILKYGFENQVQYYIFHKKGSKKNTSYFFTLEMAIGVCMMHNPNRSKKFFITLLDAKDTPF